MVMVMIMVIFFQLQERPTCSNDLWAAGLPWAGQSGPQTTYMGIVEAAVLGWYRFFVLYSVVSACKAPIKVAHLFVFVVSFAVWVAGRQSCKRLSI